MNEFNELIKGNSYKRIFQSPITPKKKNYFVSNILIFKLIFWLFIFLILFIILIWNIIDFKKEENELKPINKELKNQSENIQNISNFTNLNSNGNITKEDIKFIVNNKINYNNSYDIPEEENSKCKELDPINIYESIINTSPKILCKNKDSYHICYQNNMKIFQAPDGIICKMNNIILDPSKWKDSGKVYNGPIDQETKGAPLISEGFFNMNCDNPNKFEGYARMYERYINSWNYKNNENENIEELAPGKFVFLISRNQDSPNLFHGGSEFLNAFSMMILLNIYPEDIQIVFLESMDLSKNDNLYNLYKNIISAGNEPIHVRNLKKKYHISSGIHIPINWDSPCFLFSGVPECKNPTKTYFLLNKYTTKYMNILNFTDFSNTDSEIFYYPSSIDKSKLNEYKKFVTIQWRKIWPKGRKNQHRILGNGPELADSLSSKLPGDILLRLVDTSRLTIEEQISIMKKTDYFIAGHGAGLFLSVFLPSHSMVHEIMNRDNMNSLILMSSLSGHRTFSNIIKAEVKTIDDCEQIFFNVEEFTELILNNMKENNFYEH